MGKEPSVDLSEFFKLSKPRRRPCPIGWAIETGAIPEHEVAQLQAACATDVGIITATAIVQWLAARGTDVNPSSVTVHRRRTCSCE